MMVAYQGKIVTHNEAGIDLPPRPENHLSGPRRRELVGEFAQDEVDPPHAHLGLNEFAELVWIDGVEELIATMDNGQYHWNLVLLRLAHSVISGGSLGSVCMYGWGLPTNVVAPGLLALARVDDSGTFPGRSITSEHQRAKHQQPITHTRRRIQRGDGRRG